MERNFGFVAKKIKDAKEREKRDKSHELDYLWTCKGIG